MIKDPAQKSLGIDLPGFRRLRIEGNLTNPDPDRRRYPRYDTEVKVFFKVSYDVKTVVKFQLFDREKGIKLSKQYEALGKNVSVEGLRFSSEKELAIGESLWLEVYLPNQKEPIVMEGEVRWCKKIVDGASRRTPYDTGVKIISVNGEFVPASIYRDEEYQVTWSILLESVLGNFRIFQQSKNKK